MKTEELCKPSQRYLFASEYLSGKAIAAWQSECIKRCKDKQKDYTYERYIHWQPTENEIAIFTLYAYANFDIPKKFDIIFHIDNPMNFLKIDYKLTQSIYEAWFPSNTVIEGHKHLCIFSFEQSVPDILNTLHKGDEKYSTSPKGQSKLGFCHSKDFEAIQKKINEKIE